LLLHAFRPGLSLIVRWGVISCSGDACRLGEPLTNRAHASTSPEEINQYRALAIRASRQLYDVTPREPDRKQQKLLEFKMSTRKTRMEGFIDFTEPFA
jgi:hypothetical protein